MDLTNAEKLLEAASLMHQANCLMQEALGPEDSDTCYQLHNDMENIIDTLDELAVKYKPTTKYTVDQIADAAEKACFYVTTAGLWLRMDFCDMDEGYFQAHDEESFEEYRIEFEELVDEDVHFEQLAKVQL